MKAHTKQEAYDILKGFDPKPYAEAAARSGRFMITDIEKAGNEYRHFLLLVWIAAAIQDPAPVVPTPLADAVWREHIFKGAPYRELCNRLFGVYLEHPVPFTDKQEQVSAIKHTHELSKSEAADFGFVGDFFDGVGELIGGLIEGIGNGVDL